MPHDDDRPSAMLGSRDERIQSYLRTTRSTDDIVHEVTSGFASDVARIMSGLQTRSTQGGTDPTRSERRRRRR